MKYLHTMIRVRDLEQSLDFYCNKLGLIEIKRKEVPAGRFTLVFLAASEQESAQLELTWNWDDEEYGEGRNFGHLAYAVENIYDACKKLMDAGVTTGLYQLPVIIKPLALVLIFFSFILFASAILPTRLLQFIRHPQLMFVISWALAHLLLNGDSRSVVVFGGLGIWAILEIFFINRRDGDWVKPTTPAVAQELKSLLLSIILFAVTFSGHFFVSGIALY